MSASLTSRDRDESNIAKTSQDGDRIKTLSRTTYGGADAVKLTDVKNVASYSWLDKPSPTIAVPGSPNVWMDFNPRRVPQDSGVVFIDQNSFRMGSKISSLTPIFGAIEEMHQGINSYDYTSLDVVSDRNNLRKLLRWATGDTNPFEIDIDCAGRTCLFTRREVKDSERVVGFKGFGNEYEKAATRAAPGCENATGHHRIISMSFGDLKILLRFEVDACVASASIDDLTAAFSSIGIDSNTSRSSTASPTSKRAGRAIPISIIRTDAQKIVPLSHLIKIKTRVSHRELDWGEVYPQLYLSQTAYLYLAKHTKGTFGTVEKFALGGASMAVHAKRAEAGMGKLKALLDDILKVVRKEGNGARLRLLSTGGNLALYKRAAGAGKPIGDELLSKFSK